MADFDPEQSGDVEVEQPSGPTVGTVPAGALPSYAALKAGKIESAGTDPALTKFVETPLVPTSVTKPLAEAIDFPTPQLTALSDTLFPKLELGKTYEKYVTEPTAEQLSGLTSPANIAATVLTGGLEGLFRKPKLPFNPIQAGDIPVENAVFRTSESVGGVPRVSAEDMRPLAQEPLIQATTPTENLAQIGQMGGGIVGNMYDMLFKKLQAGDLTEAGMPSNVLRQAYPEFQAGNIKTPEDLARFVNKPPTEGIPSASEITSPAGIISGEVRPSMDEEASLRQSGQAPEVRPQAEEVPQEIKDSYDQAQSKIDDIENRLEAQGLDPTKLVDPSQPGVKILLDSGWKEMPPDLVQAYKERDAIGSEQLKQSTSELSKGLQRTGLNDSEIAAVLDQYAIKPGETGAVRQALASEHAPKIAATPPAEQAESIAYKLAVERGEQFDELKEISPKTLRDAANAVQVVRRYFGKGKEARAALPEVGQRADVMALAEQGEPPTPTTPKAETAAAPELSITSIKNEQVDAERAARNLPPVVEPARKAFGASWDEASKKIDENPNYPDQLIGELKSKPRALTDVEDATLLHRQVELQNQYQKGAVALFKATEAGDEVGRLEASARVNALSDQLLELYEVGKKAGTETGRGLAARRLLAAEDFSLANMVTQKRAALQGAQLSEEQVAQVNTAKNKVSAAQIALDAYETSPKAEGYRKRLETLAEQYRARTAAGDFAPRKRTPIPLDKDLERRQADLARAKKDWYTELAKDQAKNRTPSQKFWDRFVGVERAMKLSSDVVLAKLTAAAAVREAALTPAEEAIGGAISKVLPGLAKRAPREGGFSLDAEIKAKAAMFTDGMKDAWQNLKMKQTNLDELYKTGRIKAPDEFYDYLGYLHGALKAPVKRAEFTRSLVKRMKWATENGQDLNNVNTMRAISEEAYVDANRSIFLQDNIVSDVFTGALRMAEKSKKAPNLGPAVARIGRFLVPIVKVPTNIVGEVATGVHGPYSGGIRAARAYIKGIESLPTAQGDSIMRQLKKGAIGNSLLLSGYFGYKSIGGFYHDQDKRTADDVQAGRYRVGNVDIPASAGHSTGAMLLNIGATVHRVQDEQIKKTDPETKGLGAGVIAAGQGLAHEVPFVPAVTGIADALGSKGGLDKYIMNMIQSTTTPALVTHAAKIIDTPGTFPKNILQPATSRKPTTPIEAFETTIPGIRERVPERKLRGTSSGGDYIR